MNKRKLLGYFVKTIRLNQYQYNHSVDVKNSHANIVPHGYQFRQLNGNDLKKNNIFLEKNRITRYCQHIKNGHRCYAFVSPEQSVVAYFWLTIGKKNGPIQNPAFKYFDWLIHHNEAYIWDCRTVPAYRQQGFYRKGLQKLAYFCLQKKINKIMISCDPNNLPSHLGILSAGFEWKGKTTVIKTKFFKAIRCHPRKTIFLPPSSPVTSEDVFPWI